jgi:hypothetical protein
MWYAFTKECKRNAPISTTAEANASQRAVANGNASSVSVN